MGSPPSVEPIRSPRLRSRIVPLARRIARGLGTLLLVVAVVVLVQTVQGFWRAPNLPTQAPGFELVALDGGRVALADLAGRTVVLNFWATWCGPCRMEMPSFARFAEEHTEIVVHGIAVDGDAATLERARAQLGIPYPILRADPETLAAYGVKSLPTTVVVGPGGEVRSSYSGMLFGPQLRWLTR